MSKLQRFEYEVVPVDTGRFTRFAIEIPTASGKEFADRRAYWEAFHVLGRQGIGEEEFIVSKWINGELGLRVGPGGNASAARTLERTASSC